MENKFIWTIKKIEDSFGIKLKRNSTVLGLDCATKTGFCIAKTDEKKLILNVGFINVDVSKIEDKDTRNEMRYTAIYEAITNLFASTYETVTIENVYYAGNVLTLILLSRIGAIAWTICKVKGIKNIIWRSAVQARKALGLPSNKKKIIVQKEFSKKLGIVLENEDEIDAVILALNGLLQ
jgi:Holliday junction resolvasome RuvABC endonuclease subunit